jgi:hypothetical protein
LEEETKSRSEEDCSHHVMAYSHQCDRGQEFHGRNLIFEKVHCKLHNNNTIACHNYQRKEISLGEEKNKENLKA